MKNSHFFPMFRGLAAAFGLLGALALLQPATGQVAQGTEGQVVKRIEVQYVGPASVSRERIMANMRTAVGQPLSSAAVEDDVRALYASGQVSNVRIFSEAMAGGVKVTVMVETRATVKEVVIEGANAIPAKRVRKALSTKPKEPMREDVLEKDRQAILELYTKKGYGDAEVQYRVQTDEATGASRVTFAIVEGDRGKLSQVGFEGNTVFSSKELRRIVKTSPRTLLKLLSSTAGKMDAELLDKDARALREHYQNNGYADADVVEIRKERVDGARMRVVFVMREGGQYKVGKIDLDGFRVASAEQVRGLFKVQTGDIHSPKAINAGLKAIRDHYGKQGYVDLRLEQEATPGGAGVLDLNVVAEEGGPSYVEKVTISGNTRTKDKVIRRELAVAPGDLYDTVLVDASKARLSNLGYFSRVETFPSDTGVEGRKDLNLVVEEQRTGTFNFGVGFSSIDNLIGFVELTQGNFDITRWPSFTGAGQKFRIRAQYGLERSDFVASFTEPWFLDYRFAVGVEGYYREMQYLSDVYDQRTAGVELSGRQPLGEFASLQYIYRFEDIRIDDLDRDATEEFLADEGSTMQSRVGMAFIYDRRDNPLITRRGQRFDFGGYLMGDFLGSETDMYGLSAEFSQYFPLPWDTVFLINAEVAVVDSWGDDDRVPIFNRLYLGGANNLRGFDYRDVGPKDERGEPVGGLSMARLTAEYTFPIIPRVRGAIFYDLGIVSSDSWDFGGGDLNSDVGAGLRLDLPIGPIRLDFGYPLQSDEFNDSTGRFNFNIGYQF